MTSCGTEDQLLVKACRSMRPQKSNSILPQSPTSFDQSELFTLELDFTTANIMFGEHACIIYLCRKSLYVFKINIFLLAEAEPHAYL